MPKVTSALKSSGTRASSGLPGEGSSLCDW